LFLLFVSIKINLNAFIFQSLSFGSNCPRFTRDLNNLQNLPEIQRFNEEHQPLYNYLKENSGLNFTDPIDDTLTLYDILLVEVTII